MAKCRYNLAGAFAGLCVAGYGLTLKTNDPGALNSIMTEGVQPLAQSIGHLLSPSDSEGIAGFLLLIPLWIILWVAGGAAAGWLCGIAVGRLTRRRGDGAA